MTGFLVVISGVAVFTYTAFAEEASCSIEWKSGSFMVGPGPQVIFPDDCNNPFGVNNENIDNFVLAVGANTISSGELLVLPDVATSTDITLEVIEPSNVFLNYRLHIFTEHDGVYTEITQSTISSNSPTNIAVQIPLSTVAEQEFHAVVSFEYRPIQVLKPATNWFTYIREKLIPTAHAMYRGPGYQASHVPFTIQLEETELEEEEVDEPVGASNVLFLPGIMGSRLYACKQIS